MELFSPIGKEEKSFDISDPIELKKEWDKILLKLRDLMPYSQRLSNRLPQKLVSIHELSLLLNQLNSSSWSNSSVSKEVKRKEKKRKEKVIKLNFFFIYRMVL